MIKNLIIILFVLLLATSTKIFAQEIIANIASEEGIAMINEEFRKLRKNVETNTDGIAAITGVSETWIVQSGDTIVISDGIITSITQ